MILRKPYAIFIKYFKLLHIILAALSALLLYRSFTLYNFFKVYSIDYRSVMVGFSASKYISSRTFVFCFLVLVLTSILLFVMIHKNKPRSLYLYNLFIYVFVFILYYFCDSALDEVRSIVLDIKFSKALRDFSLIACILQTISLVLVVVRAIGFDLKQFDFSSDLQELDISEMDSEEIEVALKFDQDELKRNLRKNFRNFKYVYVEHKFIINMAAILVLGLSFTLIYFRVKSYTERYSQGESFSASGVTFNVQDTYILNSDSDGNKLVETDGDDPAAIIVVRFQVSGYGDDRQKLNTGLINLRIGDLSYNQSPDYAVELYDIGTAYVNQALTDELTTYTIAFEVSAGQANKNMSLKFNDSNSFVGGELGAKNILVSLKPVDLRKENEEVFKKELTETISFDDSVLGSSSMKIDSFEINNKFKLDYKYCYRGDKCIDSYEYVTPTATGNYFKTLMRINGNMTIDKNINNSDIYDLRSFLNTYGVIYYKVDDEWQKSRINSSLVKPKTAKTNDYFIEVPYEVKDASEIYFSFKIRNQNYKYTLK